MPYLSPWDIKIGSKTYYRVPRAHSVTKVAATKKAKDLRKEGHLARVIKDPVGDGWTAYYANGPADIAKLKKELPKELWHMIPRG
jgi:hypothetical protein